MTCGAGAFGAGAFGAGRENVVAMCSDVEDIFVVVVACFMFEY